MSVDPEFHNRFADAFETAFTSDDATAVIRLCEDVLEPDGGFLFDGYTRDAPKEWRIHDA